MKGLLYLLFCSVAILIVVPAVAAQNRQVVGWAEKVRLFPGNLLLEAKIDTGADNSSLDVASFSEFHRGGEKWVRFQVVNGNGDSTQFERKVVRLAKIKRHAGKRQERPVVILGICLGNFYQEAEVNLVDRSKFKYQLLIGRSFMGDKILVDPAKTYIAEPQCREAPDQ